MKQMKHKTDTKSNFDIETINASKLISYAALIKNPELISHAFDEKVGVIKNDKILFYIMPKSHNQEKQNQKIISKQKLFNDLCLEYFQIKKSEWSPRHYNEKIRRYHTDLKNYFKDKLIQDISLDDVLGLIKSYQARGVIDLSHRLLSDIGQIFDYAIVMNLIDHNFCPKIRKAIVQKKVKGHACINESEIEELLLKICSYENARSDIIKLALKFMVLTFVRVNELLNARWSEIDMENSVWIIPAERMKIRREHHVPLSSQAKELINEIKEYTNNNEYVFPHYFYNKPLKSNRLIYALYKLGYKNKMTVHGFRALASSVLNNNCFNPDAIEKQLAHEEENRVRRAYNRAEYMDTRIEMMQWWSDYVSEKCPSFINKKQMNLI